jgi:hypothetical protein
MFEPKKCAAGDCGRDAICKGYCGKHWQRVKKYGTPADPRPSLGERFWSKVDVGGDWDCWPWVGSRDSHNYGVFTIKKVAHSAHRISYQHMVGPIPEGDVLDHVCHSVVYDTCPGGACPHRACVNPAHLEPVTNYENLRRARFGLTESQVADYCAVVGGSKAKGVDILAG